MISELIYWLTMKLVTADEMRSIEEAHLKNTGGSIDELMTKAGGAVAAKALGLVSPRAAIVIFCGKGNNGGDGFVAARLLQQRGYAVRAVKMAEDSAYAGPAAGALAAARHAGVPVEDYESRDIGPAELIIDALLGFGLKGPLRGSLAEAVEKINNSPATVLSVDVPTGVDSDEGSVAGAAVMADHTLTFTAPKRGLYLLPGAEYAGEVELADIGISGELVDSLGEVHVIDKPFSSRLMPRLLKSGHKKSSGRVLMVAGSAGMTGAAALAAAAAMRGGAGLCVLVVPESLNDIMEIKLTEVMTVAAPETASRCLDLKAAELILGMEEQFDSLALGPGLGRHPETLKLVLELVRRSSLPMVLDADGLYAVSKEPQILRGRTPDTIITPHSGELGRLLGLAAETIESDRLGVAARAAEELAVTVVLKGYHSIVAGEGFLGMCQSGNPGMATAGAGDVLTGVIAALAARGLAGVEASAAAVYAHGLAGDLAAADNSLLATVAGDLLDYLPRAYKLLSGDSRFFTLAWMTGSE